MQHFVESLRLDWLVGHDAVLVDRLPCDLGRLCGWNRGQGRDLAEQSGEREEVVGEGGLCAEV